MITFALSLLLAVANVHAQMRFTSMGDWGGQSHHPYTTESQVEVAKGMATVDTEFFLALGDNFYNDGVPDLSTNRFEDTWSRVYNAPTFMKPWHLLAGNHDHKGNVTAQIDYSHVNSRWNYPAPYYVINKKFADKAGNGVTVDIVMIDTVLLAGSWDHHEPQPLFESELVFNADDQWSFIHTSIANSSADWILVAGHYPIYSVAEHGPTNVLIDNLLPLMQQYGAALYMGGHEHNCQFLTVPGVDMVVTGAAHSVEDSRSHENDVPPGSLKFFYGGHGSEWEREKQGMFTVMTMNDAHTMTTQFLNEKGHLKATFTTNNPRTKQ